MPREHNTYEDLIKQESSILRKTKKESPEIGWYKEIYEDIQKIIIIIRARGYATVKRERDEGIVQIREDYLQTLRKVEDTWKTVALCVTY
jgi:hypothetical protein